MGKPENRNTSQRVTRGSFLEHMPANNSEMASLIREVDWSKTELGSIENWPQSLQTAVSICLFSRFPILIWWGRNYIKIYNDAYRPILGSKKHPDAMGRAGREVWGEIWHIIGPMLDEVYKEGKATWSLDQLLPMDRNGFLEETYFTFSYSPIFDETGGVGGIFTAVTETTKQVLSQRRLKTLHDLGEATVGAKNVVEACQAAASVLVNNLADLPFSLLYLFDENSQQAILFGSSGIEIDSEVYLPSILIQSEKAILWPIEDLLSGNQALLVESLSSRFGKLPKGLWDEAVDQALLQPITSAGSNRALGFLVLGLSPRLALDEDYRLFCELLAGHLSTAVANARAHEEEWKRAEALAELDRAKTRFFSNVSHEFRTPLTLMLNPLQELLQESSDFNPKQRENLELTYRSSLRLHKLVNALLDFSRIQANRIEASYEPTDLAAFTTDLASNFRSLLERAGLYLEIDCTPLSEPAYVDRHMWEKIVLNLLSNAFKFTFEGGISVYLREENQLIELKIQDTGIGIAKAELPYIFERFHQVQGVRARSYEGSGIGLALVAELVALHQGEIQVSSEVNVGTVFSIRIPLGSAHLPQEQIAPASRLHVAPPISQAYTEEAMRWLSDPEFEKAESAPQGAVSKYATAHVSAVISQEVSEEKILIVDDNADMRDYLRRLLEQRYQVQTASDGIQALKRLQERPSLVILDVMMPNLDGFKVLKQLRFDPQTRNIPVILLSARAGEEARVEGLETGADDYMVKPFSARELMARVESQLQLTKLRRENQEIIENILEGITDPFYVLDEGWNFIYSNQRAQDMLGKKREELIGRNIAEYFMQEIGAEIYEQMRMAVEKQRPSAFETLFSLTNRWTELNIYPGSKGIALYFREIHEQREAEASSRLAREELEAEQERIVTIFESISDAFVALDKEFRYTYLNPQAAELLYTLSGNRLNDLLGKTVWETFPGSYESPFGELYREVLAGGQAGQLTAFFPPLNTWFNVKVYPSKDGLSIYFADVTEKETAQIELRESREQLAGDLSGMIRLYKLNESLLNAKNFEAMLQEILKAAIAFTGANKGNLQLLSADGKRLEIAVHHGHGEAFLEHFRFDGAKAICLAALEAKVRIVFADVANEPELQDSEDLKVLLGDGINAVQSTPLLNRQGQVLGMISTHFPEPQRPSIDQFRQLDLLVWMAADYIEHTRVQEALREAEARLKLAQEAGNVGIWDWLAETQETYWTETMWKLYGLQTKGLKPSHELWMSLIHPDDRQRVQSKINRLLDSTESRYQDEFRIIRADGLLRWIESVAEIQRDEQQKAVRMSGINLDITGRKMTEGSLREAEAYLRELIDSAKYAIFAFDANGHVMTWNSGAERLFGYSELEMIGQHVSALYSLEDQALDMLGQKMDAAVEFGYAEKEHWYQRKDGSRFYASGMLKTIRDSSGSVKGFTQITHDTATVQ